MDTNSGEIITAIDFESYTADNTRPYDHMQFTSGSEGMFIRLKASATPDGELDNSIEKQKSARCGLLQGVFQTCSAGDATTRLENKSVYLSKNADVFPQKVYSEKDSSGNDVCTWQMAKTNVE